MDTSLRHGFALIILVSVACVYICVAIGTGAGAPAIATISSPLGGYAPLEDQLRLIGPTDIEILANHLLEEGSARDRPIQHLGEALRDGADDYLIKPLRRLELLARIESVARRGRSLQAQDEAFEVDDLRVDCVGRAISRDGAVFELTAKDFDLAVLFLRNVGRLLSRSRIHEAVWGTVGAVTSRTIDTHVSRIRNKLGLTPRNGWQLKSVYGHGYRLEQVPCDARVGEAA